MNKPHKHAALIKQWADGAQIQIKMSSGDWKNCCHPSWLDSSEYRVKPPVRTVKYRRYIVDCVDCQQVLTLNRDERDRWLPNDIEDTDNFVRWIDKDWITETV